MLVVVVDVEVLEVVVVVGAVVVVVVLAHGVVLGRHSTTNASRSRSGLVPVGAVAFAGSRRRPACVPLCTRWSGIGRSMKLPQAESRGVGTAAASLEFTCSFCRWLGGWQVGRFGSRWSMQTATRSVQELLPHSPSTSQGSPSVQETTRPPRTSGPGLSMPWTFNST